MCVISGVALSCGPQPSLSAQRPTVTRSTPSWYLSPPASSPDELYGVGEGVSQEESVERALAQVAAQLHVTLKTRVRSRVTLRHGVETEARSIDSELEVAALELRGYEVIERAAPSPVRHLALVRVSKPKLARDLSAALERGLSELEAQRAAHQGPLARGRSSGLESRATARS